MTTVTTVPDFIDELHELLETKDDPDAWYILTGKQVGEYSIHTNRAPPEVREADEEEMPPDMQDATENVDGFYQIGTQGWAEDAFVDDVPFVEEAGFAESPDLVDRRINGLLLVHESVLSEEALEIAAQPAPEVDAE